MSPSSCRTLTSALARSLSLGQRSAAAVVGQQRAMHMMTAGNSDRPPNVLITGKLLVEPAAVMQPIVERSMNMKTIFG